MSEPAKLTERQRSRWKARMCGVSAFAMAAAAGWIFEFDVYRMPDSSGNFLAPSGAALSWLLQALLDGYEELTGHLAPHEPVLAILQQQGRTFSFLGRIGIVLSAATFAALPIAAWRFQRTPRRMKTKWIGLDIPAWSEGRDAILNANSTLADGIARTGRGLEVAPAVTLSAEQMARSILTIGDPGSGKTLAFWHVIFELQKTSCFMIVHDTKGDLTARWPAAFILLAPHDTRSWAWAIGRDIVGKALARELATLLVAASDRDPSWPAGAQEILVGVIITLQREKATNWGWTDLKDALDLTDASLREFACRYHPAAQRFLALDEIENFTKNAASYLATLMAPLNKLIGPLADAWGDVAPEFQLSLCQWLDDPKPSCRTLILQRAPDLAALSAAWIGTAVQTIVRHLVSTRRDRNPGDTKTPQQPDVWFLLDEFAQLGPIAAEFFPLLEVGRSLGLRAMIGLQNFQQLLRINNPQAPAELLQLVGNLIAFRMNPGPDRNGSARNG
jgi:Type IV secretion-system coupling protein DNA-binding domain